MPELKTIDEAADILRVRPVTVRRLIAAGKLPCSRVGRRYVFTARHIEEFIARNGRGTGTEVAK